MPITRISMNTTGLLRTIDDEAKVVELPEDDAIARLPKLYAYYEKLEAKIRKVELDIGWLLRSVNCVNAKASAYQVGDVVAVRSHPLSAAGYGLMAKFMPRYQGEFKVIDCLSKYVFPPDYGQPK